ncbi:methyltransferase domain-containing protein [Streptomyces hygroscopicus]
MTGDTASLRRALAAKIGGGSLKDPAWRAAVGSVPRELFLGAGLFRPNGLAESAAASLRTAGYAPTLVTGDGLHGYRDGAEYDAVVATCAVRHIPRS